MVYNPRRRWCAPLYAIPFILAGPAPAAVGAEPVRVTLEQCLEIGLREASARVEADLDERIALTRIEQVRAQVLPQVGVTGAYTRLDELARFDTPEGAFKLGRLDNYSVNAEISQLLYAGGAVRSAMDAAHSYRALNRAAVRQVEQRLRLQIRTGFYGVLLARRTVAVREASLEQARAMAADAERRHEAGTGSDYDRLAAQVRLANEQPLLLAAQRDYRLARSSFRDMVRLPAPDVELEGELEWRPTRAAPAERIRELAREHRPEIDMMDMQLALLRADLRAEQGSYLPSIQARASYGGSNPASFASAENEWEWGWEAGVVAHWALFNGALTRNRVREKRHELEKGRLARDDLVRAIELDIEQALLDVQYAAEAAGASRESVQLAERGVEIVRTRFQTGTATRLEYTDAQLALNTARLAEAQALRDHLTAVARLTYAAGVETAEMISGELP